MQHQQLNPFPTRDKIGLCVDEMCTCGAKRSSHEDTIGYGHGPCPRTKCARFTFKRRIYQKEPNK